MSTLDADGHQLGQARRDGALADEAGGRHLRYRRALEQHLAKVQEHLALVQAATHDPAQRLPNLSQSWRQVREARELYDAAAEALRQHRATR